MYREDKPSLACPVCGGTHLTEETRFDPSEGYALLHFQLKTPPRSSWDSDIVRVTVDQGRICLSCGHVMLSLSAARLRKLAAQYAELKSIPSEG